MVCVYCMCVHVRSSDRVALNKNIKIIRFVGFYPRVSCNDYIIHEIRVFNTVFASGTRVTPYQDTNIYEEIVLAVDYIITL